MSIQVRDFVHVPGENDAEYIRLLKEHIEREHQLVIKAMASIHRTGHWSCDEYALYHCSECGCEATWDYNYCPMCGARMNGGKQDD